MNDIILKDYYGIIGNESKRFLKQWPYIKSVWEYNDLFQEGTIIFYDAKRTYDSEKGKFVTHFVNVRD